MKKELQFKSIFTYDEIGFKFSKLSYCSWDSIETVFTYKIDLMTIDEICIDIFTHDKILTVNESTPGWVQFTEQLDQRLPLPKNWEGQVMLPAFVTNLTLLFDSKGRTQEQCIEALYK